MSTLYTLVPDLFDNGDIADVASDYSEPGYRKDGDKDIVFANWNPKHMERLAGILERRGYTIEWSDEWATCSHCYNAIRTQADSYSWQMFGAFLEDDGEFVCGECLCENPEWIIDDIMNDPRKALRDFGIDLEAAGWSKCDAEFESGWYGREDDPEAIVREVVPDGHDYLFALGRVGQFSVEFTCWTRPEA